MLKENINFEHSIKTGDGNVESNKEESILTLVETIEELGYIPRFDNNNEDSVA